MSADDAEPSFPEGQILARKRRKVRRDFPEPDPVEGARWIQLGGGAFTLVSEEDYDWLNIHTWTLSSKGYVVTMMNVARKRIFNVWMHHVVNGKPPHGLMTDHKNRCTTDNRRLNLRFVTNRGNYENSKRKGFYGPGY